MSHLGLGSREERKTMFKFVLTAEDGFLTVRSNYQAGDRVAQFVEMHLRALVESLDRPPRRVRQKTR